LNQRGRTGALGAASSGRSPLWPALRNLAFAPKIPGMRDM
jgi:hypothetical protein